MQNYFDNAATTSSAALHATMKPARGGKCLVTFSTYEDRKEALLNTTILDDAGTYRSKGPKLNSSQQNNSGNTESIQNTKSQIPNPPPLQMDNSNSNSNHNSNGKLQTCSVNNGNKMFQIMEQNGSQNSHANNYNITDTYGRPNKTSSPTTNGTTTNPNRHTLRLGTVTIGEYRQQTLRREPEKFNFIAAQKKSRDSGDTTTPTNETLQSELQNTLSRANLRKSNSSSYTEHQRNCPLHQQQQQQLQQPQMDASNANYTLDDVSKKFKKTSSLNENSSTELLAQANNRSINYSNGTIGVGILKNGNRHGSSSSSNNTSNNSNKSTEKSIKFG